ncbi:D-aminoacyl-tRNA deacylase [Thiomicrorhabdus sp. Milos-T2]|uniref:D-aminoacyl-tRNA deacylase n=1 Tax=Thiomicrorhabdus sp. Milos-T2 TaxID=90814 RepID=UPI00049442C5|nr:D-aminoacyl-tRNA deacylase [Thiomicrorhabdus sp. Milos-T2]
MICLIQRVTQAKVEVNSKAIAIIGPGLVVLTAFQPNDNLTSIQKMAHKLLNYRVFADENDKMNLNIQQANGQLLLVPQFTLAATTQSGLRPSFSSAAAPDIAENLFGEFVKTCTQNYALVKTGKFGADMQVSLTNNGPVTFWLET